MRKLSCCSAVYQGNIHYRWHFVLNKGREGLKERVLFLLNQYGAKPPRGRNASPPQGFAQLKWDHFQPSSAKANPAAAHRGTATSIPHPQPQTLLKSTEKWRKLRQLNTTTLPLDAVELQWRQGNSSAPASVKHIRPDYLCSRLADAR